MCWRFFRTHMMFLVEYMLFAREYEYLKNELDELRVTGLEEELKSREAKNKRVQLVLIGILAIYIIVYYYYQFLSAFKLFE